MYFVCMYVCMYVRIAQQTPHQPLRLLAKMAQASHCRGCGRMVLQEQGFLGLLAWALDTRRTRNMDQWLPVCLPGFYQRSLQQLLRFTAAAVAVAVVDAGFCVVDVVVAELDFKIIT